MYRDIPWTSKWRLPSCSLLLFHEISVSLSFSLSLSDTSKCCIGKQMFFSSSSSSFFLRMKLKQRAGGGGALLEMRLQYNVRKEGIWRKRAKSSRRVKNVGVEVSKRTWSALRFSLPVTCYVFILNSWYLCENTDDILTFVWVRAPTNATFDSVWLINVDSLVRITKVHL